MSQYRKGYRIEDVATDYMLKTYNAVCVRSGGSHGIADLICGNGETIFVVQVKGGTSLPYISWIELEQFAKNFNGVPLLLYKPDYRRILEARCEKDLVRLRNYLRNLRGDRNDMREL